MNNTQCYFIFSGYCKVAAASELLCVNNIPNRIVKAPIYLKNSCNFAVVVRAEDEDISHYLLERNNNLPSRKSIV